MSVTSDQLQSFERDGYLNYGPLISVQEANLVLTHLMDLFASENLRNNTARRTPREALEDLNNILQGIADSESDTELSRRIESALLETRNVARSLRDDLLDQDKTAQTDQVVLQLRNLHEKTRFFHDFVRSKKLLSIAESFVGPDVRIFGDQALLKPAHQGGAFPWHTDNGYWQLHPPNLVTCWIALNDVTEDNGALRFIPGSQTERQTQAPLSGTILHEASVDESKAVTIELATGACSWHHSLTLHNTKSNTTSNPRPAYAIIYMGGDIKESDGNTLSGCPL